MTRPPLRSWAAIIALAILLAVIVTLLSGSWKQSVRAEDGAVGTALVGGFASWYEDPKHPRGYYAAAGPLLREALRDWRGQYVTVEGNGRSVTLVLSDFCACGLRHGKPTFLDLSRDAFAELADPSVGILAVSIEIGLPPDPRDDAMRDEVRDMPLPATDAL